MKVSIGRFVCIFVTSVAFFSCNWFFSEVPPINSKAVVSYRMIGDKSEHLRPKYKNGFILGKDTLESWFPHVFDKDYAESKCNYFAMYFATPSTIIKYWILSKGIVLYKIKPYNAEICGASNDIVFHVMLVCDNTEEGNLKDIIDLNSIRSYTDEDWDCRKEKKNVFF
ncbi:MAG: hypothetical protein LBC87_01645 [Fibromonadaceae bacterium]|jgi:hypothetical protein|nr:hypothetical protein [Fibromonadaceae bacterium]